MEFQLSLPIRLAASSQDGISTTADPLDPPPGGPVAESGPTTHHTLSQHALSPNTQVPGSGAAAAACGGGTSPNAPHTNDLLAHQVAAANGPITHQFWLKDSKVAEELFTLHRSAEHLVGFAASIMGHIDSETGEHRPVAVMSDGDLVFMTQLSKDIVNSINRITQIRQHGTRIRKRKIRHGRVATGSPPMTRASPHRSPRASRETTVAGSSKRMRKSVETDDQLQQCYKCGRKETPEWRKGPDGLLCNSCGLVHIKQRRKQKAAEKSHSK